MRRITTMILCCAAAIMLITLAPSPGAAHDTGEMITNAQLLKRIEALEARIEQFELRIVAHQIAVLHGDIDRDGTAPSVSPRHPDSSMPSDSAPRSFNGEGFFLVPLAPQGGSQ